MDTEVVISAILGIVFPFFANIVKCKLGWSGPKAYWAITALTIVVSFVVVLIVRGVDLVAQDPIASLNSIGAALSAAFISSQSVYNTFKHKFDSLKCE